MVLIWAAVAGLAGLLLAQDPVDAPPPSDASGVRQVDRFFLTETLSNSRSEVEVSRLALAQAGSSDIREFAQQLITDNDQIGVAVESLARRKSVAVPIQPTSFSADYRLLAQRPGAEFDRAFVRKIADESEKALQLCEIAVQQARDPDVRTLAGSLLPVIRAHVNRSTDLQKSF